MHRRSWHIGSFTCLLVACGASSASTEGGSTPEPSGRAPLARWEDETLGPLRLTMSEAEIVSAIGEPPTRPPVREMEATGERVAVWSWPDLGIEMSMVEVEGSPRVASIRVSAPCGYVAGHGGVAIGSARADVVTAYADLPMGEEDDPREDASRPDQLIYGNAYARLSYTFTDGRVSSIFLGSTGAE